MSPYKSKAQQGYFHANEGKKGLTGPVVRDWDNASRGMRLPEKATPKKKGKK
jgi:hypothetical protein